MSADLERRVEKLEENHSDLKNEIQDIKLLTTRIGDLLETDKSLVPKVQALELELAKAGLVIQGVKWLAACIGASAAAMVITHLFGG